MRLGIALVAAALLAACSGARLEEARAKMGCGPVDGLKQIVRRAPDFIIVGEFTETSEAPAAFAELACNLVASGEPLFVGVSEYLGGATEAEAAMRVRLEALKAKGAPILIGVVDDGARPYDTRARTASERKWADAIAKQVTFSGAARALLLVSHTDARNQSWPRGERFAGYDPMPMHLEGDIVSLEIGALPVVGLTAPAIRLYPASSNGFDGQIALPRLTRSAIGMAVASVGPGQAADASSKAPDPAVGLSIDGVREPGASNLRSARAIAPAPEPALDIPNPAIDLPDFEVVDPAPD